MGTFIVSYSRDGVKRVIASSSKERHIEKFMKLTNLDKVSAVQVEEVEGSYTYPEYTLVKTEFGYLPDIDVNRIYQNLEHYKVSKITDSTICLNDVLKFYKLSPVDAGVIKDTIKILENSTNIEFNIRLYINQYYGYLMMYNLRDPEGL